jgi:hypothetical protein
VTTGSLFSIAVGAMLRFPATVEIAGVELGDDRCDPRDPRVDRRLPPQPLGLWVALFWFGSR